MWHLALDSLVRVANHSATLNLFFWSVITALSALCILVHLYKKRSLIFVGLKVCFMSVTSSVSETARHVPSSSNCLFF